MGSKRIVLAVLLVGFVVGDAYAQNGRFRRRGTIVGGVAGAAIGAAIGDRSNNEAVGAVIGGVTGAALGRSMGEKRDYRHQTQYNQPYNQPYTYPQQRYYPQPAPAIIPAPVVVTTPHVVTPQATVQPTTQPMMQNDVVAMLRSGLSEQMISIQIQNRRMRYQLSVDDVIALHQQGVSENLIQLMQANAVSTQVAPRATYHSQTAPRSIQPAPQVYVSPQVQASGSSILVPAMPVDRPLQINSPQ